MPSPRRVRLFFYTVLAGVVVLLFFTSSLRQSQPRDDRTIQDFYHKTKSAMDRTRNGGSAGVGQKVIAHDHDADGDIDEDDEIMAKEMAERLRQAEQKAKDNANAKAPNKPDVPRKVIGVGSSADGQAKKDLEEQEHESDEEHEVEIELNATSWTSPPAWPASEEAR